MEDAIIELDEWMQIYILQVHNMIKHTKSLCLPLLCLPH